MSTLIGIGIAACILWLLLYIIEWIIFKERPYRAILNYMEGDDD